MPHKAKRGPGFVFNPFEVAICGFRNSGKTTLACRLIEVFSGSRSVGYVKHDAHRFDMDREGKDTHRAAVAGAAGVLISNAEKSAQLQTGELDKFQRARRMLDVDMVIAEGFKRSGVPKVVMLDTEGEILELLESGELENVMFCAGAGPRPSTLPTAFDYLDRDAVDEIAGRIAAAFATRVPPLRGLVLVGGKSQRMGQDKAALDYHGHSQALHTVELLQPYCSDVLLSCRAEQDLPNDVCDLPRLADRFVGFGPMGGILSAQELDRTATWLVLAVDLPFVSDATLAALAEQRNPFKAATAFISTHDGFPEPLCAAYEPKSRYAMLDFLGLGYSCPRKVLINTDIERLTQNDARWLDNVNHPAEYEDALKRVSG
jgi:molybdopterin-guanine dinucleotide biosynthesis protein MobB